MVATNLSLAFSQVLERDDAAQALLPGRDTEVMSSGEAPEERKKVAHGVSRGNTAKSAEPRQGRKNPFRPLRGLARLLASPTACAVSYFPSP
ncbi:MAG: hypothetical protein ABSF25_17305 [Bryobacteraceae bacterium]